MNEFDQSSFRRRKNVHIKTESADERDEAGRMEKGKDEVTWGRTPSGVG